MEAILSNFISIMDDFDELEELRREVDEEYAFVMRKAGLVITDEEDIISPDLSQDLIEEIIIEETDDEDDSSELYEPRTRINDWDKLTHVLESIYKNKGIICSVCMTINKPSSINMIYMICSGCKMRLESPVHLIYCSKVCYGHDCRMPYIGSFDISALY